MPGQRLVTFVVVVVMGLAGVAALMDSASSDGPSPPPLAARPAENSESRPADLAAAIADRSPVDLALGPDERWLVAANQTSSSVSLVRTADGQVLAEVAVPRRPAAIVAVPGGQRVLVSGTDAGVVTILEVAGERLSTVGSVHVGYEPYGVAASADGRTAYVALSAADQVAVIDLEKHAVVARIDVARKPRYVALSPDGRRLAVGVSGDRGVCVVNVPERKMTFVDRFAGLNIGHMEVGSDNESVYFTWTRYGDSLPTPDNIRRGWVTGARVARLRLDGSLRREALALDHRGKGVGDVHGVALAAGERWLVAAAGGTQELLVMRLADLPLMEVGEPELIDAKLAADSERFYRIPLGGRPMGIRASRDERTVYVANYLANSVQAVDLETRAIARTIPLGKAPELSPARRGEFVFHDARRSLDQWYSCHSCHYDGGSNALPMDTLNDGSSQTYKTVLPLYHLKHTGPYTWHGWQSDLADAMHKSLTSTMVGPPPSPGDVADLIAYLDTLEPPPNPFRRPDGSLGEAAERGKGVFHGEKAGCANCHNGPYYTDGQIHDVGLGKSSDRYKGYNTPSLLGVHRKVRLLHDGRAYTLDQLLTGPHDPAKVTGSGSLSDAERADLIEFLKSL